MFYLYLMIAILGEVAGTYFLRLSEGFSKLQPTLLTLALYSVCFYFLALSLKQIPLNIAYATWGGIGLILTTFISVLVFKEAINLASLVGISLILIGVVVLNLFGPGH